MIEENKYKQVALFSVMHNLQAHFSHPIQQHTIVHMMNILCERTNSSIEDYITDKNTPDISWKESPDCIPKLIMDLINNYQFNSNVMAEDDSLLNYLIQLYSQRLPLDSFLIREMLQNAVNGNIQLQKYVIKKVQSLDLLEGLYFARFFNRCRWNAKGRNEYRRSKTYMAPTRNKL